MKRARFKLQIKHNELELLVLEQPQTIAPHRSPSLALLRLDATINVGMLRSPGVFRMMATLSQLKEITVICSVGRSFR